MTLLKKNYDKIEEIEKKEKKLQQVLILYHAVTVLLMHINLNIYIYNLLLLFTIQSLHM